MKRKYERPIMMVEEFRANRAIAACEERALEFDCMMGNQVESRNVITDEEPCKVAAGYAAVSKAYHPNGSRWNHTDTTGGTWTSTGSGLTYTGPTGTTGLLYICTPTRHIEYSTDQWSVVGNTLTHAKSHGGNQYHCEIMPVANLGDVAVVS